MSGRVIAYGGDGRAIWARMSYTVHRVMTCSGLSTDFIAKGATEAVCDAIGDWVDAEGGKDQVFTGAGDDLITGGDGNDFIVTSGGNECIYGDWNTYSPAEDDWRQWSMNDTNYFSKLNFS